MLEPAGSAAMLLLAFPGAALAGWVERLVVAGAYVEGAVLPVGRVAVVTLVLAATVFVVAAWRGAPATGAVRRSRTAPLIAATLVVTVWMIGAVGRLVGASFGDWLGVCCSLCASG